jgi:hypothetical protein
MIRRFLHVQLNSPVDTAILTMMTVQLDSAGRGNRSALPRLNSGLIANELQSRDSSNDQAQASQPAPSRGLPE